MSQKLKFLYVCRLLKNCTEPNWEVQKKKVWLFTVFCTKVQVGIWLLFFSWYIFVSFVYMNKGCACAVESEILRWSEPRTFSWPTCFYSWMGRHQSVRTLAGQQECILALQKKQYINLIYSFHNKYYRQI